MASSGKNKQVNGFWERKKPTLALRKGRHIKTKRKTNFLSLKAI